MKSLTTETALDILIAWLQDNIAYESGIIFDNDEDKTEIGRASCRERV